MSTPFPDKSLAEAVRKRKSEPLMPPVCILMETASGRPCLPSDEQVRAVRRMNQAMGSEEQVKEDKENERPVKRQKANDQQSADSMTLLMAGGDGPHVTGQSVAAAAVVSQPVAEDQDQDRDRDEDDEEQFEDSFLDAPDLDLTQFVSGEKSPYFETDADPKSTAQ